VRKAAAAIAASDLPKSDLVGDAIDLTSTEAEAEKQAPAMRRVAGGLTAVGKRAMARSEEFAGAVAVNLPLDITSVDERWAP
jgi:hypothetical protein